MRRFIQTEVEDRLANEIILNYENKFAKAVLNAAEDGSGLTLICL